MRFKLVAYIIFLFIAASSYSQDDLFTTPPSDRVRQNIDFDWRFYRGDFPSEEETHQVNQIPWKKVDLPHDWTITGPFKKEHNTTQGFLPMEIGWYKKGIRLPECWEDKKVFIVFDGVYRSSDVWMNYAFLGHHESGYTSFSYDLTDYVRFGNRIPNGLRVRVDGRRHEQDMYEGNGIYRHVWLVVTNKLHVANWGTFVSTPVVTKSKVSINIKTKVQNENYTDRNCKLITKIVDSQGIVVADIENQVTIPADSEYTFIQKKDLSKPHLWSIEDPYLYKTISIVMDSSKVVDTYETSFGIRTFYFDSEKGFFLNNEHVKLKGFNAHYDFAGIGTAIQDRISWNLMIAMKNAGFNFYRSSHNPATPERVEICDKLGILVWEEIERKLESAEIEHKLVEETIIRDRNHPSIILWSLENESPLESTVYGAKIMKSATELAHKLDPTRLTTFAASMPVNKKSYGENVDVVSYNYHWERADKDHIDFPHWKIGLISEYSAARARRGVYGIEYLSENVEGSNYDLNNGEIQTMYQMCDRVEDYWGRIKSREYIGGGCLWSGVDAWGEGNAWPYISRGDGALDLCLFPKDVYYYFVSQWREEPMVHIFPHWNWQGQEGKVVNVWAYSNCDQVELYLNGNSLGIKKRPADQSPYNTIDKFKEKLKIHPEHLVWEVPYEAGTLRVEGKKNGKVVCVKEINTSSKPYKIELSYLMEQFIERKDIPSLVADSRDIVVIKAEVLDKDNNVIPNADNLLNFSIEGDAKIIGVGNGNINSHESNKSNQRQAYNGLCAVIIQSSKREGIFTLRVESEGLRSDEIKVKTVPAKPKSVTILSNPYNISSSMETSEITAEICDKYGSVIPSYEGKLIFKLKGPALFENKKSVYETEIIDGKAVVNLQSINKTGRVEIKAEVNGIVSGKVEVLVK